jgi:Na+/proline symporter
MIGFTVILLAYTAVGGMLAVVYTDFLQMFIMIAGVVFAIPLAVSHVGGVDALFTHVQEVNPLTFTWESMPRTLLFTMGMAFLLGSISSPAQVVRLYAMRDMRTIRRGILLAILVITSVNLMVFVLSLVAVVMLPALPTGDLAMPMIAKAVLPPFIGGIMLAAITSAMMSTVDSLLIVAGSALSRDIYQTLINPDLGERGRSFRPDVQSHPAVLDIAFEALPPQMIAQRRPRVAGSHVPARVCSRASRRRSSMPRCCRLCSSEARSMEA